MSQSIPTLSPSRGDAWRETGYWLFGCTAAVVLAAIAAPLQGTSTALTLGLTLLGSTVVAHWIGQQRTRALVEVAPERLND